MEPNTPQRFDVASYIDGQLMATQAMVFALARLMPDPFAARDAMLQSLEKLRVAGLPSGMGDEFLDGIDKTEALARAAMSALAQPSRPDMP